MDISNEQFFTVNSKDRLDGDDSNFTIKLNIDQPEKITHVCLLKASFPRSFYNVQSSFSTFILYSLDLPGPTNQVEISIIPANYSRTTLKNVIKTALNNAASTYSLGYTFEITTPSRVIGETGKYTFSTSINPANQPAFIFLGRFNLYELLGFDSDSVNTFVSGTLVSQNVSTLQAESTININSNIVQSPLNNILESVFTTNTPTFGVVEYLCPNPTEYARPFSGANANSYYFSLSDEDFNQIDLNGNNSVFLIKVFTMRSIYSLLRNFIKMNISESELQRIQSESKKK